MGIAHTTGESCLMRRILHSVPSASGSISGSSGQEFWELAIFRSRGLFCALRGAEETACGACSCSRHLTVDIRIIFHKVNEDAAHITCSCGEFLTVGPGDIIGVSPRVVKKAYVSHVICKNRTIGAAAGDIGTIRSLVSGGLARKPSLHAILLLSEPP